VFQQIACCFSKSFSSGSGQPKNVSVGRKKWTWRKMGSSVKGNRINIEIPCDLKEMS
jgi:hypothetical protein